MAYTIKDVAKKAGVSIATVSRVLNGKDVVKDKTREKILRTIDEIGYITNFSAKTLRKNKTDIIGAVVPDISVSFYSEIIKGIENKANEFDLRLVLCDSQNNHKKEKDFIKFLYEGSIDGMIFVVPQMSAEEINKLKEDNFSLVVFGNNTEKYNIPSIMVDNKLGAYNAVRHFYSHGFKRIAYIGGIEAENDYDHRDRLSGYKKALEDCRLEFIKEYVENGQYCEEGGKSAFIRLMKLETPPDAVFCANDEMALGVLKAAKKNGIKIPEQVGLIGFDNIRISQYTNPALTTVSQPSYNIGVLLCEKLVYSMRNKDSDIINSNLLLKPELIIRESCGR